MGEARFVTLIEANPFHPICICEGDVSSDRSAEPPTFLVLSSENYTVFAADTISLSISKSSPTAVAMTSVMALAVIGAGLMV